LLVAILEFVSTTMINPLRPILFHWIIWKQDPVGPKFGFQHTCERKLKHHNFLSFCVQGKIMWNCNEWQIFFLLYLYLYLLCNQVFFYSGYVITYPLVISTLMDVCSLHYATDL